MRMHHALSLSVLSLSLLALPACRSTEQVRKEATMSAPTLREGVLSLKPRIDAVMNALLHMEGAQNSADVAKTHAVFSEKVAGLTSRIEEIRGEIELMERQGLEYFQVWGREYSKAPSAESELQAAKDRDAYKTLTEYMSGGKEKMRTYVSTLRQIDAGVKANPTQAGVRSMGEPIRNASPLAVEAKAYADRVAEQIEAMLGWKPK